MYLLTFFAKEILLYKYKHEIGFIQLHKTKEGYIVAILPENLRNCFKSTSKLSPMTITRTFSPPIKMSTAIGNIQWNRWPYSADANSTRCHIKPPFQGSYHSCPPRSCSFSGSFSSCSPLYTCDLSHSKKHHLMKKSHKVMRKLEPVKNVKSFLQALLFGFHS